MPRASAVNVSVRCVAARAVENAGDERAGDENGAERDREDRDDARGRAGSGRRARSSCSSVHSVLRALLAMFEVDECGQHASVAVAVLLEVELLEERGDVLLDARLGDEDAARDRLIAASLGDEGQTVRSRSVRRAIRSSRARRGEQLGDDLGIEHRRARTDAFDGVEEVAHVGDAVFRR
jgi:hypothetical protein